MSTSCGRAPAGPGGCASCSTAADCPPGSSRASSVDGAEIDEHRLAEPGDAAALLSGPVRRRVLAALGGKHCVYLEDGRPVESVRDRDTERG